MKFQRAIINNFKLKTLEMHKLMTAKTIHEICMLVENEIDKQQNLNLKPPVFDLETSSEILDFQDTAFDVQPLEFKKAKDPAKLRQEPLVKETSKITEFYSRVHFPSESMSSLLIFVYPLIGGMLSYLALIDEMQKQIAKNHQKIQTIIGIEPLDLTHSKNNNIKSIENLAENHLKVLEKYYNLKSFESVIFIGASFGASLAYEMAYQCHGKFKVKVVSIDGTLETTQLPSFEDHKKEILRIIHNFLDSKEISNETDEIQKEIQNSWKLLNFAANYKAPVFETKVLLLRTINSKSLESIWRNVCGAKNLTTLVIPGTHETMLSKSNAYQLSHIIFTNITK
uniref:Polyketide synthase thioesterase domain-containing protein n=1 Tax=Panagrolaimus sp. JU765 TaxID=591449 RepID=A0AC34RR75_9BILA